MSTVIPTSETIKTAQDSRDLKKAEFRKDYNNEQIAAIILRIYKNLGNFKRANVLAKFKEKYGISNNRYTREIKLLLLSATTKSSKYYNYIFSNLNTAKKGSMKAPHKPILLLSIIELIQRGVIRSNAIKLNDALIAAFNSNFEKYAGNSMGFNSIIATPFWHLQSESFWKLIGNDGKEFKKGNFIGSPYSVQNINRQIQYAEIDIELFNMFRDSETRRELRYTLMGEISIPEKKIEIAIPEIIHKIDFLNFNPEVDETLRAYQNKNKQEVYNCWQGNRSVMLQMPTGTGKTRLFVSMAKDMHKWAVENRKPVKILFLAHRAELIEQISHNLGAKYHLAHGLIMANNMEQKELPIQVGSVPTLSRRLDRWGDKEFDFIIIDEAHHVKAESYQRILNRYPMARILGVTATPYRLNGAGFSNEFDELIISDSVAKFIKDEYLSQYDYYSIKPNSKTQHEIENITEFALDGDYLDSAMVDVLDKDYIRAKVVKNYLSYANGKRGIVYTINKQHNRHICQQFIDNGISAKAIDSDTKPEVRKQIVADFRAGKFDVLCNVNIFSEGFDCPEVEFIQLARPTKSLSMFLQQVGRGLRTSEGKDKAIFIDNVGLYNRFGLPSSRRYWKKHFLGKEVTEMELRGAGESDEVDVNFISDYDEGDENVSLIHSSANESQNEINVTTPIDMKNYENDFMNYLRSEKYSDTTVVNYVSAISKHIDKFITDKLDTKHKSLFNIIDIEMLELLQSELFIDPEISKINSDKHNRFSAAFKKYVEFARQYDNSNFASPIGNSASESTSLSLSELDATIALLNKGGFPIPAELTANRDRIIRQKVFIDNIEENIKSKLKDIFEGITTDISLGITYSATTGLTVSLNNNLNRPKIPPIQESAEYNGRQSKLRIITPNGKIIQSATAKNTLIEVIKYAGVDKVKALNLRLSGWALIDDQLSVKPHISSAQTKIEDRVYINTLSSTAVKVQVINEISSRLGLNLKVELI